MVGISVRLVCVNFPERDGNEKCKENPQKDKLVQRRFFWGALLCLVEVSARNIFLYVRKRLNSTP